jgi:curved DNA-binding protein CbpA
MINYYEILIINRNATEKQVKAAFKKLAVQFHPDKNPGNKNAEEKFKTINEAYQTLSDITKRDIYDQKLEHFLYSQKTDHAQTTYHKQSTTEKQQPKAQYKPEDFSTQGKHYSGPYYDHNKRSSLNYVIAFTIIFIIATGALLFGFMMNNIAATEHYKTALLHYETEDYVNSMRELNKAVEFNEKYGEAYLLRAEIKYKFSKYESALPDYNLALKYLEVVPKGVEAKRNECREEVARKLAEDKARAAERAKTI